MNAKAPDKGKVASYRDWTWCWKTKASIDSWVRQSWYPQPRVWIVPGGSPKRGPSPRSPPRRTIFNLTHQDYAPILAQCEQHGIAYLPYFPPGGGRAPIDQTPLANVTAGHQATAAQVAPA
jgi:hypothetical protein